MNSPNDLEIKGFLHLSPLGELLTEIAQVKLNGSLRLESESHKAIIYFDGGEVVFAVSNARQHRLFELVLRTKKITAAELAAIKNFANDAVLKDILIRQNLFSKQEIDELFTQQIEEILQAALGWKMGSWVFSPLVRVKGDIRFRVDLQSVLLDYARVLDGEFVTRRFKDVRESFVLKAAIPAHINLLPPEAFVLSRFQGDSLTIEEIKNLSGLSETETYKTVYTLWLAGFLKRQSWNAVFSERKLSAISSAKLALKKGAVSVSAEIGSKVNSPAENEQPQKIEEIPEEKLAPKDEFPVEEFLKRTENAENHYEVLGVSTEAAAAEIKTAYLALAKRFHPDLFQRKNDEDLHRRVQHAFTQIAHAYETLKTESSREVYDFKLRKGLASKPKSQAGVSADQPEMQEKAEMAEENCEQGISYLLEEDYEQAIPLLARAVHLVGDNARYHAYYGKALANNKDTYRQAEAELQTAVRLDGENSTYRLMLVEVYLNIGLLKRAVGELNRLLAIEPDHAGARALLDSLLKKGYK